MSRTRTNRKSREAVTGGMTHPQIAEILGVSPQRVQQIERRALAKLRKQLEPLSERIRLILSGAACFAMSLARGADMPPIPAAGVSDYTPDLVSAFTLPIPEQKLRFLQPIRIVAQ